MLRLVTLPISHYCEKARWALDRAGLEYREERHIQLVHMVAARRAGGGRTVPVLVTPDGAIGESAEIVAWADRMLPAEARLYPEQPQRRAEVERLCERFDRDLGPTGRRLIYVHMLPHPEYALPVNNYGVPPWEDRFLRLTWPVSARMVGRILGIERDTEAVDTLAVWRELDFAAELLSDGRPYLTGESLTAADVTFAALAAPVITPPEYSVPLPQPEVAGSMAPDTAELVRRARAHPAGKFALELFAKHRRERVPAAPA